MPRSDSERLTLLQNTRDAIDDALLASAGNADVISYTMPDGRVVQRNRAQAQGELDSIERRISQMQLRINGPASNRVVLRRRP